MNWKSEGKVTYRWYWRLPWSFLKLALCQEFTFCNFQSHMAQLNRIHGDLYSLAFGCQAPHRRPKLQLWDDILHNNSHGGIIRVCMGIFTTALRNKKYVKFSKKKTSPYFHSVSLVIWPLTLMKRAHLSELFISRFSTYIRKAQGWTLHFRTPDPRSEKSKLKMIGRPQIQRRIQAHIL